MKNELLVAIVVAFLTYYLSTKSIQRGLLDSLDSKSEWRKNIFLVASKSKLTLSQIYLVRTVLRYDPKSDAVLLDVNSIEEELNFDNMTKTMIDFC